MKKLIKFIVVLLVLIFNNCYQTAPGTDRTRTALFIAWGLNLARDARNAADFPRSLETVISDYNTNYLGSEVSTALLAWTGNTGTCTAGTVSAEAENRVIKRVNYFRRQTFLPDAITLDTTYATNEREAALMMHAQGTLSHDPQGYACFTANGAEGAGKSNLALGAHSATAITLYMEDPGAGNTAVGHRRWILYSKLDKVGHGSTSNANALRVIGYSGGSVSSLPEFVSWPPKGYVPRQLAFDRWSFSLPNKSADFTNTTISMTGPSGSVTLTKLTVATGYGDNTVVWEPTGINTSSNTNVEYTVNLKNVLLSGTNYEYTYKVVLVNP